MTKKFKASLSIIGRILLLFVFAFLLTLLFTVPIIIALLANGKLSLTGLAAGRELMNNPVFFYGATLTQALGFIAAVILMRVLFERKSSWRLGWRQVHPGKMLGLGLIIGIAMITVSFLGIWLMGALDVRAVSPKPGLIKDLLLSAVMFTFVAINEELIARGYIQGLVTSKFGAVTGIIVSSLLFALLHSANHAVFQNPLPMINLLLAGLLFAVSRRRTGGLWMPIGIHFAWNFFQGNIYGFAVSGMKVESLLTSSPKGAEWLSGGSFGAEGSLVSVLVLALMLVIIMRWIPDHSGVNRAAALL